MINNFTSPNALIKSCVRLLIEQIPSLYNFHTSSSIPKFKECLDLKISTYSNDSNPKEYFKLEQTLTAYETNLLLDHFELSNKNELFAQIRVVLNPNEFKMNNSDKNWIHKTVSLFLQRELALSICTLRKRLAMHSI